MPWTRRDLLRAGATAATALLVPGTLLRPSAARAAGAEPVLVLLVLRGGADWLTLVPPIGDERYAALRPALAVPSGDALALNGFFGLHPALLPLHQHYAADRLAVVHAFGSPHDTRSHFDAQDFLESGVPGNRTLATGWLGRYASRAGLTLPWAALTMSSRPARALAGASASLALERIESFDIKNEWERRRRATIDRMVSGWGGEWGRAVHDAFAASETIVGARSAPRAQWPSGPLAETLRDLGILIRARIGVRVGVVDMGGWDHHVDQATELPASAAKLAAALDAFVVELGAELDRTVVLVMTEFGRSAVENGSGGTEHGRGSAMLALGGPVRGGRVRSEWPGLGASQLVDGRDLAVTTDYRDACAEVLQRHMGLSDLTDIFPGYSISSTRFPGIIS